MTSIKYDVSIPVGLEQEDIRKILKKYKIRFDYDTEYNDTQRGLELVAAWINFATFVSDAIDELKKVCEDMYIHAYKADRSFYKLHVKTVRKPSAKYYNRGDIVIPW